MATSETTLEGWKERNLRRVDVEGVSVVVLRDHAREHLESVNRKLAIMKMALHRIKRLGEAGTAQLAEDALEEVSGRAALLRDFVENQDG